MAPGLGKKADLERSPPPSPTQWTVAPGGRRRARASSSSSYVEVAAAIATAAAAAPCSICLEPVKGAVGRATTKLHCGHEFHLDCIGSAFNVKGAMQCPNCRKIENGRWLYANGQGTRPFSYDISWLAREINDMVPLADPPIGLDWYDRIDIDGYYTNADLASMFGGLPQAEAHQTPSFRMVGDHSGAGSSSQANPQFTWRGLRLPAHVPSSASSGSEGAPFQHNPTGLEGHATPAVSNAQASHASEPRNLDGEHQYSGLSPSSILNRAMASFARAPQGYETSSQRRSRPYIVHHHCPLLYRLSSYNGSNNLGAPLGSVPAARGHGHAAARGHLHTHAIHPQLQSNHFPATTRRVRPRGTPIASLIGTAAPSETSAGTTRPGIIPQELAPLAATMNPAALNMILPSCGQGPSFRPPADWSYGWFREAGETPYWWRAFMSSLQNQNQNPNPNLNQNNQDLNRAHGRLTPRSAAGAGAEPMPPGSPENASPPPPSPSPSPSQRRSPSQ